MDLSLSGIDFLRKLMASGETAAIGTTLGFHLAEIEPGKAVFESVPTRAVYNPINTVHGGYAATLLDSACGCAVHSMLEAGQGYTTLELKVSYLKALTADTGKVRAEGWVTQLGRRAAFAEAGLVDESGKVYATATSTLLVMTPG